VVAATVTLVVLDVIEVLERALSLVSRYPLTTTSPSAVGVVVVNPVIVLVEADITISPTDIPLLTLKFLVVMVPYLPHDCYY
jgi:flagellar assembly factor FliW